MPKKKLKDWLKINPKGMLKGLVTRQSQLDEIMDEDQYKAKEKKAKEKAEKQKNSYGKAKFE